MIPKEQIVTNNMMLQIIRSKPKAKFALKSGMDILDKTCGLFRPGELYIISGYTKRGKSLLCKTLTKGFYNQGEFPLYFQYEEMVEAFLYSFPRMSEDLVFYLPDDIVYNDPQWLEIMIKQGIRRFGIKVVFIDHLHFLFNFRTMKISPSGFIGDFVRDLKKMAIDNNIVMFLVCHTTKPEADESKLCFTEAAIRDSGLIAQYADSIIFVHRKVTSDGIVTTDEAFVMVRFHRRTGVWDVKIAVRKEGNYLREL